MKCRENEYMNINKLKNDPPEFEIIIRKSYGKPINYKFGYKCIFTTNNGIYWDNTDTSSSAFSRRFIQLDLPWNFTEGEILTPLYKKGKTKLEIEEFIKHPDNKLGLITLLINYYKKYNGEVYIHSEIKQNMLDDVMDESLNLMENFISTKIIFTGNQEDKIDKNELFTAIKQFIIEKTNEPQNYNERKIQTFIKNDKLGRFVERKNNTSGRFYNGIKFNEEYKDNAQLTNQKEDM